MKNKRWQNLALGLAFALPVIGVYVGKRLLSKNKKLSDGTQPEVTRIRIPLTSLIGLHDSATTPQSQQPPIVLPEDNGDENSHVLKASSDAIVNYIASIDSGKFHKPDCRWAKNIKSENRLIIENRSGAIERGYTPCSTCNP